MPFNVHVYKTSYVRERIMENSFNLHRLSNIVKE